ncbi:MAG: Tetratricopeptide repeat protein [Chthoniobacteraceae bacterium]|nr:Tetratricopeptide repeat protein [Chthoniobacteraceae bacterium]
MKSVTHRLAVFTVLVSTAFLTAGSAKEPVQSNPTASPPAELDLGSHSFKVSTRSGEAQRAFDRGLTLAYAFSHLAAEQEFRRAAEADPQCAMAWWGIALVNGPHINVPAVQAERAKIATEAVAKARELAPAAGKTEHELIEALGLRYRYPQPEDRAPLDQAYAEAMRNVWKSNPENADVATLCAEALMDLHPWDLWLNDGRPQPWTPEIVTALEQAIALNVNHPGANHLYIHAVEASAHPERALAAADRLGGLVPGASHTVHMPAHIYARLGRWEDAALANQKAITADLLYRATYLRPGFYALYMAHNQHFLAYTAMMRGRGAEALENARAMAAGVPANFVRDYPQIADGYVIFPSEVLLRFGRWEEVLAEPRPPAGLPLSNALWHFTRAAALNALDRPEDARLERDAFLVAAAAVPKQWTFGNNSATDLLAIATLVIEGEMAARDGRLEQSINSLSEAVRIQDTLRYDEPPDWIQPVRHTLGAVLLKAGRAAEAETVYREDLAKYPENGWALFGLASALRQKGDPEAPSVEARFVKAWASADIRIASTCQCVPGT